MGSYIGVVIVNHTAEAQLSVAEPASSESAFYFCLDVKIMYCKYLDFVQPSQCMTKPWLWILQPTSYEMVAATILARQQLDSSMMSEQIIC